MPSPDYPMPRRGKRTFIRWLGVSLVLHGAAVVCVLVAAYALPGYLPAQSGGVMMVSLAGVGGSAAGAGVQQEQREISGAEVVPTSGQEVEKSAPSERKVAETAVPLKKKPVERHAAKKTVEDSHAADKKKIPSRRSQKQPHQAAAQSSGASVQVAFSGNRGGEGARGDSSNVSGHGEHANGGASGRGNPQPQVMPWNAQGGPRFLRQAPLRYPRAAQRRNLEGKAVVEAYLDPQGKLVRARVLQADHQEFAEAALTCVESSSFRPARREGKAIPCVVRIPMRFVLKGL